MIKLTEGWDEPKKDSEGEDDGFKKEEGEGFTPLTRPSSTSPNSLLAAHSKWRPSNERSNKRVFLHPKTPALQATALAAAAEVALPSTVAAFAVDSTAAAETVPKPLRPASGDEVVVEVVALFIERRNSFRVRMPLHGGHIHSLQGQFCLWMCDTLVSTPWFLQKLQKCGPDIAAKRRRKSIQCNSIKQPHTSQQSVETTSRLTGAVGGRLAKCFRAKNRAVRPSPCELNSALFRSNSTSLSERIQ